MTLLFGSWSGAWQGGIGGLIQDQSRIVGEEPEERTNPSHFIYLLIPENKCT